MARRKRLQKQIPLDGPNVSTLTGDVDDYVDSRLIDIISSELRDKVHEKVSKEEYSLCLPKRVVAKITIYKRFRSVFHKQL